MPEPTRSRWPVARQRIAGAEPAALDLALQDPGDLDEDRVGALRVEEDGGGPAGGEGPRPPRLTPGQGTTSTKKARNRRYEVQAKP